MWRWIRGAVCDVVGGHEFLDGFFQAAEVRDVDFFWEFSCELPKVGVDFGYLVDLILLRRNQDFEVGKRGGELVVLLAGEKRDAHPVKVDCLILGASKKDDEITTTLRVDLGEGLGRVHFCVSFKGWW